MVIAILWWKLRYFTKLLSLKETDLSLTNPFA